MTYVLAMYIRMYIYMYVYTYICIYVSETLTKGEADLVPLDQKMNLINLDVDVIKYVA